MGNHNPNIVGQTINNWYVIKEVQKNESGARRFLCRCSNCGSIAVKTKAQVMRVKSNKCADCPPDYKFQISGPTAEGTLPDGTKFLIDTNMIPEINLRFWHLHKSSGYIVSEERGKEKLNLHRAILGVHDGSVIVDHINRNRLDCRKCNLREVTAQQNSMNAKMRCDNSSGYVGVSYVKSRGNYRAQISLGGKDIRVLTSKSSVQCAQAYNIASCLLHGDFSGQLNDVPKASEELTRKIYKRCLPYLNEATVVTQPCGLFLCADSA